jgi:hypothetical protein
MEPGPGVVGWWGSASRVSGTAPSVPFLGDPHAGDYGGFKAKRKAAVAFVFSNDTVQLVTPTLVPDVYPTTLGVAPVTVGRAPRKR